MSATKLRRVTLSLLRSYGGEKVQLRLSKFAQPALVLCAVARVSVVRNMRSVSGMGTAVVSSRNWQCRCANCWPSLVKAAPGRMA